MATKTYRCLSVGGVNASPAEVFAFLDDQTRLGAHMNRRSLMMLGGRMRYDFDAAQGHAIGSVIRIYGSFLGLSLFVCEAITERRPPFRKRWETCGPQRMLVIESYLMGFETRATGSTTEVSVAIEYRLPRRRPWCWISRLVAPLYARWCVSHMDGDTRRHFDSVRETGVPT